MKNSYKSYILLFLAVFVSGNLYAYDFKSGGIYYNIIDNNSVSVTKGDTYNSYQGNIVIPEKVIYNGITYYVTSIGLDSFYSCYGLKTVLIPNSVTTIGPCAFMYCPYLTSVTIPNSVTVIDRYAFCGSGLYSIIIPKNVKKLGDNPFDTCHKLQEIVVETGNPYYDSRDNCNAIIETKTNILISGSTKTIIPETITAIGIRAFRGLDLKEINLPSSLTSIGYEAFASCSSLTSVISEIKIPFPIPNVFYSYDPDVHANATLFIPAGTKTAYQSTVGWMDFQNIKEVGEDSMTSFIIDGITYKGASDGNAEVSTVNKELVAVKIPASVTNNGNSYIVTTVSENAFLGSEMGALIWEPEFAIPNDALNSASLGSNFLLYVKNASYTPSIVKNVVVNGTASAITLSDDGGKFSCPEPFKAQKISYSHQYSMKTGGTGKGWETIALPFDVQKISHATRGEMTPFADYSKSSKKKPFWLYSFSGNGFVKSKSIQANTPYIIAMPNQSDYNGDYILSGEVTFSAENVTVPATPTFSGAFVPSYTSVNKSTSVSVLNVVNKYVNETGGYDAGSRFVRNLRDVRPFECYLKGSGSTRSVDEMIEE